MHQPSCWGQSLPDAESSLRLGLRARAVGRVPGCWGLGSTWINDLC